MKLGYYYGLVFDKAASTYALQKVQRISNGESAVEAYTRWVKKLEQEDKGRYTTMGLTFGALRVEYNHKTGMGTVKVGFSEVAMVTPRPSILSVGFTGVANRPMYLSGKPNPLHDNTTLSQIRDAIFEHIADAVWVM